MVQGLHHAGLVSALANPGADAIVEAVGDHRPAVVLPGTHDVDLVAALRAVLMRPEFAGSGMQSSALHVAVAKGPFLRSCIRLADEGIVGRQPAVVVQADDLAGVVIEPLGAIPIAAIPESDIEHALPVEHQS